MNQAQELLEVAKEIRTIAGEQRRWIKIACVLSTESQQLEPQGI